MSEYAMTEQDVEDVRRLAQKRTEGLHEKYVVARTDGKCVNWCFVLEDKDPLAIPALEAYMEAAREAGYRALAEDLRRKVAGIKAGLV